MMDIETIKRFFFEVGFFAIMCVGLYGAASLHKEKSSNFNVDVVEIASVGLGSQVTGSYHSNFAYGYGYVNEKMYYFVYEVLPDDGLVLSKLDADKTIIYETLPEGETAYLEVQRNLYERIVEIRMYVPEGSVPREYDLSLSGL